MTIDIKAIKVAAKEDQKRDNTILLRPSTVIALCDEIKRLRKELMFREAR